MWNSEGSVKDSIGAILRLRVLVAYLGEQAQFAWWPTSFFADYSLRSIEFVAPKTAALAQYHGAIEAARRLHDEHINVGTYHLFRLPEELEQDLHGRMQTSGSGLDAGLINNREAALAALKSMAADGVASVEGPVAIGHHSSVGEEANLARVAAKYLNAFVSGHHVFPYFTR